MLLFSQIQLFNDASVAHNVYSVQVIQQIAPAADHFNQRLLR
jgi:hypothetical protein